MMRQAYSGSSLSLFLHHPMFDGSSFRTDGEGMHAVESRGMRESMLCVFSVGK